MEQLEKQSHQCGLPGVFRGYQVEKASQRKAEVSHGKREGELFCPDDTEMLDPAMPDPHHDFLEKV